MISFRIDGDPIAWARAGQNGKFKFTPKKQAIYMDVVRMAAKRATTISPLAADVALHVTIDFNYPWPKSWSSKKRQAFRYKTSRPDIDNLFKIIADSLNGIIWKDDASIVSATITKRYADVGSVYVKISNA